MQIPANMQKQKFTPATRRCTRKPILLLVPHFPMKLYPVGDTYITKNTFTVFTVDAIAHKLQTP